MSSQEVRFGSGGYTIAGTSTEVADPLAAALLIAGSGRVNRDWDAQLPLHQRLRIEVTKLALSPGHAGPMAGHPARRDAGLPLV